MPRFGLALLLLIAFAAAGCGGGGPEQGGGGTEQADAPRVPGFCADEQGRGQANLLYQVLPQIASAPDGGKSLFESPVWTGPNLDQIARHLDAVESAPASEADAGGEVKGRYVEAMRNGVEAYSSAERGDASKLASASPAVTDAYLAFATPYACS